MSAGRSSPAPAAVAATPHPDNGSAGERWPDRLAAERPALLRYARTITTDPQLAEDLVQDTLVRAMERPGSFRGESGLGTWLHRILHNLAVDGFRRRGGDPPLELARLAERAWRDDRYTVDATVVVERAEVAERLRDALERLPFSYRAAVVLRDCEEMPMTDIARIQGISLAAAKQRVRRGRMLLVTTLSQDQQVSAGAGVPLRCWQARSRVSDYLDGDLPPRERARVERHLRGCPTCPPLYAGLVGTRRALGALRDPDSVVPPQVARRIHDLDGCGVD